eukprot:CAMPEP_0198419780 /NCGR_PEP_ID=MMETSP1452-20131203/375_1 /TAXON_ID=1181717 /ORGANISM="Synchroma pusillum, Strain CCMP3072" /LENGTH=207 /DNA_ID=CAMNT_0044139917 /DNA_START=42 /DNA_END=665 /DNA_ORIENTATION=-
MIRALAAFALLASASAFMTARPGAAAARSSALKMGFETEIGAQPPLGFWDPLGLLKEADQERFDRLRYVEVKHGRIAQLAILGHLVNAAGIRLPGYISNSANLKFADVPFGLKALSVIPPAGIAQTIAFIGLVEIGYLQVKDSVAADCEARMDAAGWDAETKDRKRAIELNNGRAAQMGILALMVHEKLDGKPYVINTLLGLPSPEP